MADPLKTIKPGDRVTIVTPQGQERTGRAVMRGPHGWVLNMGGKHGRPAVASERNIVAVKAKGSRGLGRPSSYGKREYELRTEYAPVGTSVRRARKSQFITATPREAVKRAAKVVRDGKGNVSRATIHADMITLVECRYSIRPRKSTRRVAKSFARCSIDPTFKRSIK